MAAWTPWFLNDLGEVLSEPTDEQLIVQILLMNIKWRSKKIIVNESIHQVENTSIALCTNFSIIIF